MWLDENYRVLDFVIAESGHDPFKVAEKLVASRDFDMVTATGYGRHLLGENIEASIITEIKAYAIGARQVFPHVTSVLDIGGQDTKVISLSPDGRILDFEMNDKCAAGTGKFLEVMAGALGYELDELGPAAAASMESVSISSMCAVFAESEVVGLLHKGKDRSAVAKGIHDSIIKRTMGTLKRVRASGPLVFAGGVAKNSYAVTLVKAQYPGEVLIPDTPQILGAIGAAASALINMEHES